jgi:hypothetical protein
MKTNSPIMGQSGSILYLSSSPLCDSLSQRIGIFGADHVPAVSSGHSGFLHHQNFKILISLISGMGVQREGLDREMKKKAGRKNVKYVMKNK